MVVDCDTGTKKVGITGKYGTRYGASLRKQVKKMEVGKTGYSLSDKDGLLMLRFRSHNTLATCASSAARMPSNALLSASGTAGPAVRRPLEEPTLSRKTPYTASHTQIEVRGHGLWTIEGEVGHG